MGRTVAGSIAIARRFKDATFRQHVQVPPSLALGLGRPLGSSRVTAESNAPLPGAPLIRSQQADGQQTFSHLGSPDPVNRSSPFQCEVQQRIRSVELAKLLVHYRGQGATFNNRDIVELPINGLHSVHNQFSIDGVDASVDQPYMSNGYERGARLLTGSLDTIAEFRAQTGNYRAEYGRAAGSYINIVSKSGGMCFMEVSTNSFGITSSMRAISTTRSRQRKQSIVSTISAAT